MSWYTSLISRHPVVILVAVAVFSVSCIIISLTTIKLPNFSDPQLGFEARGTLISTRLTAWQNLLEATRPSGPLTNNPLGDRIVEEEERKKKEKKEKEKKRKEEKQDKQTLHDQVFHSKGLMTGSVKDFANKATNSISSVNVHESSTRSRKHYVGDNNITVIVVDEEDRNSSRINNNWLELKKLNAPLEVKNFDDFDEEVLDNHFHDDHNHLGEDGFFCSSGPGPEYSRVVVSARGDVDLMTEKALKQVCQLEQYLTSRPGYNDVCENMRRGQCCQPWSLPNYIAMLHNHSSCFNITEEDVKETRELIENCSHLYYSLRLLPDMVSKELPLACRRHNAVYSLMHYILDMSFMPPNSNESGVLRNTVLFLPMARSSAVLEYYNILEGKNLQIGDVYVSAIDFGLKNTLFDEYLMRDMWLIAMGAVFVLGCMWVYTGSFFITVMTIIAIAFSLGVAYFIYTLIFELHFFPFMNLLASIVAVGIGADDAFILTKMWQCTKAESCNLTIHRLVQVTMKHSTLSMFVTTVTTAAAFFSSYVSAVTAIRCFSVFAGLAVLVNYALMITWLPASIVLSERVCWAPLPYLTTLPLNLLESVGSSLNNLVVVSVMNLRYLWLCLLTAVAIASISVVFYWPRLRLPDSADFQLFAASHPFEQYDYIYKNKFWFEKPQKVETGENNALMPLRFVWGVVPEDNGDHLDPASRGTLQIDFTFDMAAPDSQAFLMKFCHNLRVQPFFQATPGLFLPNCFIETFVDWMNQRCHDPVDPKKSRVPCCESAKFPFERKVFNQCLPQAIHSLLRTPQNLVVPGVAGPRFQRTGSKKSPRVRAVVIEYDSNLVHSTSYSEMDLFFKEVEAWSQKEMAKAPPGMRNGFFVSQLAFYDLQHTLARDTVLAIAVSLAVSLVVLLIVTLNVLVSLFAILSITCIIFVTVAVLVLIGWKLNVLESVAISVAIGLAVDFSLHYAVTYRSCKDKDSRSQCVIFSLQRMSGPTLMAALTTAAAGAFMIPSSVLAYIQIGVFLVLVMVVSWGYSTFFLMCLLALAGPQSNFGQLHYPNMRGLCKKRSDGSRPDSDKTVYINVLSEASLSTSSTMCALHLSTNETHELDALTRHSCRYSRRSRRSGSLSQPSSRKVSLPAEQSPSATSATTIIHDDDLDLPQSCNHVS
ncbi:protein dispatched isoform X2 [Macrosteles quadrilineatus]|uniref:protein dispatched isoform X2 n=1 Tax=Macrosteles quadrilineatus TaxID=74068 RepID=UPI0023E3173E|nr:protein dispatched isoform X2 [Macrosteles quadrilineatus]